MKTIKLLLCISLFIFPFSLCFGQSWLWGREAVALNNRTIGDLNLDHPIAVDNTGNAYFIGDFYGKLVFGNDTLISKSPNGDVFVVKYTPSGNVSWVYHIKESVQGNGAGWSIGIDSSDNVYITGALSDTMTFGSDTLMAKGRQLINFYIAKFNSSGNLLWVKQGVQPSAACSSGGNSIAVDKLGNSYIFGHFNDTLTLGSYTIKSSESTSIFIAKYNTNGNIIWLKQSQSPSLASYSSDNGGSIAIDAADNIYICGNFNDTIIFGTTILHTRSSIGNVFVAKYDSSGNVIWATQANENSPKSDGWPFCIEVDRPGNVYVTGSFRDTVTFGAIMLTERTIDGDLFLVKYNAAGNVIWAKKGNPISNDYWQGYSIACDTSSAGGGYLISQAQFGFPFSLAFGGDSLSLNTINSSATMLMQFDSAGKVIWGTIFSEGTEDDGDGVGVDPTGKYLYIAGDLAGETIFGPDTLPYYANDIPFIARWGHIEEDAVPTIAKENSYLTVFPNPFTSTTTVLLNTQYPLLDTHYLEVDDLTGRDVMRCVFTGAQYELSAQGLAKGMYFIRVRDNENNVIGASKIVVQ